MRFVFFTLNLLLMVMMVTPDPAVAAHLIASKCDCEHEVSQPPEAREALDCPDADKPCCLRMQTKLSAVESGHHTDLNAASEVCCDVDQPEVISAVEPTLPRLELSDLDQDAPVATLPSLPRFELVQRVATRTFARRAPARAPPRAAKRSLQILHCVWRS